jgi:hypothetical protein
MLESTGVTLSKHDSYSPLVCQAFFFQQFWKIMSKLCTQTLGIVHKVEIKYVTVCSQLQEVEPQVQYRYCYGSNGLIWL